MAKSKLATELHPHYPESWLNIASAEARCALACVPFQATLTWCKKQGIEVSSTGHIRELSLKLYIERIEQDRSQGEVQEPECPEGYYWNGRQYLKQDNLLRPSVYEREG